MLIAAEPNSAAPYSILNRNIYCAIAWRRVVKENSLNIITAERHVRKVRLLRRYHIETIPL